MPLSEDVIKEDKCKRHVTDGELCLLVCAPLVNPLNHQVVGPDYQQVRGIAQLVEWKDRKAVFVMQVYGRPLNPADIATTLHAWNDGHKTIWYEAAIKDWWSAITPVARELPETLPDLYTCRHSSRSMPTSLPSLWSKPRNVIGPFPRLRLHRPHSSPSPLSQSPFSMLGSPSAETSPVSIFHQITETDVQQFIIAHHDKAARGRIEELVTDYDQTVDFLDKGRLTRDAILAEEIAGRRKCPRATERILGPVAAHKDVNLWTATYSIEFHNENNGNERIRGQADLTVTMTSNTGRLVIISQKAKVHDLTSSKK